MPEPTTVEAVRGVVIWDADSDELSDNRVYRVLADDGRARVLTIRTGRGTIRDTIKGET